MAEDRRTASTLAAGLFGIAVGGHLCMFIPGLDVPVVYFIVLFVGLFPLFGYAVVCMRTLYLRRPPLAAQGSGTFRRLADRMDADRAFHQRLLALIPPRAKAAFVAVLAYAVINFLVGLAQLAGASPVERDGRHLLLNHGRLVRDLTPAEYRRLHAAEERMFSGHLMAFAMFPLAIFRFVLPAAERGHCDQTTAG